MANFKLNAFESCHDGVTTVEAPKCGAVPIAQTAQPNSLNSVP
jgi:hypothetical protein